MSDAGSHNPKKIPRQNLAEAGVWLAKLQGPARGKKLEDGFREWLDASALNARAFEATTDTWQEAANLRRIIPLAPSSRPAVWRFVWATVAIAVALIAFGIWFLLPRGIATGVGEQRTLNLEDGTRVILNTSTRVIVKYDRQVRRVELTQGEALFNVASHADRPFIVIVHNNEVRALGTSFVVREEPHRIHVLLVEGKVSVASGTGAKLITLNPGERWTSSADGGEIDQPEMNRTLAWERGQVVLDDTPLSVAVAEMNRYSVVQIRVEGPGAARLPINGLFQAGDSQTFADAIALNYGLKVTSRDGTLVLSGTPTH